MNIRCHKTVVRSAIIAFYALGGGGGLTADTLTESVFTQYGQEGYNLTYDPFEASYWQNSAVPDFTSPETTNTVINITKTPNEADRLQAVADEKSYRYGRVSLMKAFNDSTNAAMYMHSLVGGPWTRWMLWWTSGLFPLVITDPSTYEGIFDIRDWERGAYSTLYLQASPTHIPVINRLSAMGAPNVKSPDGTHSVIKELFAPGQLNINMPLYSGRCVLPLASSGTIEIMN